MIVKPDHMSQGKGIFITNDVDKLVFQEPMIVQEYLNEPYLIEGLKFDLRVYVLVTSCDPLTVYVHREGLARFAT
jgi:glutathione synthase/RimK-type ligase-like ATP-grasp enzyme